MAKESISMFYTYIMSQSLISNNQTFLIDLPNQIFVYVLFILELMSFNFSSSSHLLRHSVPIYVTYQ